MRKSKINLKVIFSFNFFYQFCMSFNTVLHGRKSVLFDSNKAPKKKSSNSCLGETMGSYDSTEVWKLVGMHILNLLAKVIDRNQSCLYRYNNGTGILFKNVGSKLDIETNLKIVIFGLYF